METMTRLQLTAEYPEYIGFEFITNNQNYGGDVGVEDFS